jgi:hypothetical protein
VEKVDLKKFDPFNSRLARDIRNSLSKAFLESVLERKPVYIQRKASEFLELDLEPAYQKYVSSRLSLYEAVLAVIGQEEIVDELLQAKLLWDYGLYFEMHELLERIWINAEGNERKALQGLIRAAGMKIHAENGNIKAAVSTGLKARAELQSFGKDLRYFKRIETILSDLKESLADMQKPT